MPYALVVFLAAFIVLNCSIMLGPVTVVARKVKKSKGKPKQSDFNVNSAFFLQLTLDFLQLASEIESKREFSTIRTMEQKRYQKPMNGVLTRTN